MVKTGRVVYSVHVFYFINHQSAISTTQLKNSHVFAVGYEFNEVSFLVNSLVDFSEIATLNKNLLPHLATRALTGGEGVGG